MCQVEPNSHKIQGEAPLCPEIFRISGQDDPNNTNIQKSFNIQGWEFGDFHCVPGLAKTIVQKKHTYPGHMHTFYHVLHVLKQMFTCFDVFWSYGFPIEMIGMWASSSLDLVADPSTLRGSVWKLCGHPQRPGPSNGPMKKSLLFAWRWHLNRKYSDMSPWRYKREIEPFFGPHIKIRVNSFIHKQVQEISNSSYSSAPVISPL